MPVYAVERRLSQATLETVEAMGRMAQQTAQAFGAQGKPIRYLRSTFIPGESRCQSLFEAPNADLVRELNDAAQLPFSRIVLAVDLPNDTAVTARPAHDPHKPRRQ